ncbi:MAG: hypothetical protein ACI4JA_08485 [Oscillospiraceae bacterium]
MNFADLGQDEKIQRLEGKVRRLERKLNGGNEMSKIIKDIVGMECVIDGDSFYGERCTVLEADDEWIKVIEHHKKEDVTKIIRIDSIENITLK